LKFVVIIGVVIACSIFALSIGLSAEKIFPNQETLENENKELDLEGELEQEDSIPKLLQKSSKNISYDFDNVATINIEIYGDTFDFSAKQFQPFELTFGNGKFKISEFAIGTNLGDFLMSYGISLNDQCLTFVHTNKLFCTTQSDTLTYFINGNPVSNIAFYKINPGQEIEIKFDNNMWTDEGYANLNKNLEKAIKIQEDRIDGAQKTAIEQNKLFSNIENAVKPQMVFNKEIIEMTLYDSKNNKYFWTMPVTTYESQVKIDGYPVIPVTTNTGQTITVGDFRPYVLTSFSNVIDNVYDNLENPDYFVYEIWYMMSKLTIYSFDIGENPRFALETLVRGGGDCEDTVILIADMIRSSSHTKDWKLQLVYFDSDNPTNPQQINHVALLIDDGNQRYIIETTAKTMEGVFYAWNDTNIVGLFLDV
jgi:hypothetical protein